MFQHYALVATFIVTQVLVVEASYCGQAAIPYSLEILQNGQPVLGCARPSCFGWTANGTRAADPAQFYRIGKQPDGFFRTSDVRGPEVKNATGFQPQYSICDRSYLSDQCAGSSWIGGIAPSTTIEKDKPMKLICCYYNKLMDATGQGRVELRAGQALKGGETKNDAGRQNGFEYVANVQRLFDRNGVVYVVTMKKFLCVSKPPDNVNIGVDSDVRTFLIDNINALSATTNQLPLPIKSKSFDEQTFDLPKSMPAEENHLENVRSVHGKEQGAKSSPLEQPNDYAINQEAEDESVLVNFGTGPTRAAQSGGGVLPKAKSINNEEAGDDYEKDAEAMEQMNDATQPHQQQQQQPSVSVDGYYSQYQQKVDSHRAAEYKEEKQQQPYFNAYQQQEPQQRQQYAYYQQNPTGYQSQQPAQQAQQYHSIVNNNGYGSNDGYYQQQYQQPLSMPYSSALDPLGIFRQLTASQQQYPQQQYANNNYYRNNNNNQNAGSTYTQQQYQQPAASASNSYDSQRAYVAQTLATPTLFNSFTVAEFAAPQRNYADGDINSPHNSGSASLESPQLRIPTPEEVESAIPPVGRRLLASVTRTLFGYHFN